MPETIQNPAGPPQPRRAEIEIDGERLGYALVCRVANVMLPYLEATV
jgi:hypothetical protein